MVVFFFWWCLEEGRFFFVVFYVVGDFGKLEILDFFMVLEVESKFRREVIGRRGGDFTDG